MAKKEKKTRKKGKKVRKGRKHESVKIWQKYEVKGETVSRKNNFCPRCGEGVWLSKQKNRLYCGKCGYTSFGPGKPAVEEKPAEEQKPESEQAEEKKEEEEKPEEKTEE
ncbi:MAG: 30S ribosomal protein S27ae [Candidatus Aenigmatarchaeota archaeon]|nr:MAG: 30S ribosomal protein S27ae [Candidatus Aenigmarchaeota archaeon]